MEEKQEIRRKLKSILRTIGTTMLLQLQQRTAAATTTQMIVQQPLEHAAVPSPAMSHTSHLTPHTSHLTPPQTHNTAATNHSPCLPWPPKHQPGSLLAPHHLPSLPYPPSSTAETLRIATEKRLSLATKRWCGEAMGGRGWLRGCRRSIGGSAALEAAFVSGDFVAAAAARVLEESYLASVPPQHHLHPTTV